jgi:hypothetical protein
MSLLGIYNSFVAAVASTDLGKKVGIKPKVKASLKIASDKLEEIKEQLSEIYSLDKATNLKKALTKLTKAAEAVLDDLSSDKTVDAITNIIGNHIGDFDSIDDFEEALPEMESVKKMSEFGSKLIDLENYQELSNLLQDIQDFDNQKDEEQVELYNALVDNTLVADITAENNKLNLEEIKKDVKKMTADLCKELTLNKTETKDIIAIFDKLTEKHLPSLNRIRKDLIKHLPSFLAAEEKRLREAYPELAIAKEAKQPQKILHKFKKEVSTKKPLASKKEVASKKVSAKKPVASKKEETHKKGFKR